jgi:hypothetical protein
MAPHSGQSSQLVYEDTDGNAQFLLKVARSAIVRQPIPHSAQSGNPLAIAQSGQSSQLVFDGYGGISFFRLREAQYPFSAFRMLVQKPATPDALCSIYVLLICDW